MPLWISGRNHEDGAFRTLLSLLFFARLQPIHSSLTVFDGTQSKRKLDFRMANATHVCTAIDSKWSYSMSHFDKSNRLKSMAYLNIQAIYPHNVCGRWISHVSGQLETFEPQFRSSVAQKCHTYWHTQKSRRTYYTLSLFNCKCISF